MSQTSNKKIMKRQSSFLFCDETNNITHTVMLDTVIYFDKNRTNVYSAKQIEKREKIIDQLLTHAKNLKW